MTTADSTILRRIRKLLQLSRSSNDAEAALAAERAAQMMATYRLTEAEIRIAEGQPVNAEAIVEDVPLTPETRKRIAWRIAIAKAVARSYGCESYYLHGARLYTMGRESATQAAQYTTDYLCNEVERLCEEAWGREGDNARKVGQSSRAWKNGFRLGCAGTISRRLYQEAKEQILRRHAARAAAQRDSQARIVAKDGPLFAQAAPKLDALAIIEREEGEVRSAYAKKTAGWSRASAIGTTTSRTGYTAGKEAGANVRLGGGRAALGEGARRIRGGK